MSEKKRIFVPKGLVLAGFVAITVFMVVVLTACGNTTRSSSEITYENKIAGFSASFPKEPEVETSRENINGLDVSTMDFDSGSGVEFTDVMVSTPVKKIAISKIPEEEYKEYLIDGLRGTLHMFDTVLKPRDSGFNYAISSVDEYPCAVAIEPYVWIDEDGVEREEVYCYAMFLITPQQIYVVYGTRTSYNAAQAALDSFKLI
ncbi:hypothetical protein [Anaerotardibacter muris]|uniref:hypothetical protein n=1 Tax=Anaerotardibacter muris TaxID=2941505 RepID=UPI00203EA6DB|nr:hypothetical protein [Anaerotardibacter muris]